MAKLGTKHSLVKGIQVCSKESSIMLFQRGDNSNIVKIQQTWHKASLSEGDRSLFDTGYKSHFMKMS